MNIFKQSITLLPKPKRKLFLVLLLIILLGSLLEVASISLVFPLIKMIASTGDEVDIFGINILKVWFAPKNEREFGILLILAFAIFFTLKNLFLFLSVSWRNWFLRGCEVDVSKNLLAGYLARPYEMHARRNSTELIRNIGECVPSLYGGVLGNTALIISEILVSLAIITLLFLVDPFTAFLALVLVGGGGAITYGLLRRSMTDLGKDRPEAKRQQLQCLQQSLGGLKEVKILQKEKFFVEQLEKIQIWLQFIHVKLAAFTELPRLTLEALMIWTVVLVIYFNSFQGVSPENDSLAILALFAAAAFRLMPSVNRLIGGLGVLRQSIASAAWIQSDFAEFSEFPKYIKALHEPENGTPTPFNTLFLKDVSYTHPGASQPAVNNINLTIKHGDTLAIVGKSGAGKTTLADLVLGLNQPSAGKIWLNGEDLSDNMASWHAGLGYVPQDISFFDDTIEHNVAVGEKVIDRDCLYNALHLAQIDEFIESLEYGVKTVIGENGMRLSGGQRQRLGIARALYKDPDVIVFDEATSALDSLTEKAINSAIDRLKGRKTIILIAHRLSSLRHCSKVVFMDKGALVGLGSFDCLYEEDIQFREFVGNYD